MGSGNTELTHPALVLCLLKLEKKNYRREELRQRDTQLKRKVRMSC